MKISFKQVKDRWLARLFTRYPVLLRKWAQRADIAAFSDTPWAPLNKAISASRIALITTGGVHLTSQSSFDMLNPSGDASYREIPADAPTEQLHISHNYYDHSDADRDINIIFPIQHLQRLEEIGEIGAVSPRHFSLLGHISSELLEVLVNEAVPGIIAALQKDAVDAVLLTPA